MLSNVKPGSPTLSVTKTLYAKTLYLVLFINFSVVSEMSPIKTRVSDIRSRDHRGVPLLTRKKVEPSKTSMETNENKKFYFSKLKKAC